MTPSQSLLQTLPFHHGRHPLKELRGYVVFGPPQSSSTGLVEVPVVDVYEDALYVYWRYRPNQLAFYEAFREELAVARRDFHPSRMIEPGQPSFDLEVNVGGGLVRRSLKVDDDLGTSYRGYGGGTGGVVRELTVIDGTMWFEPSLPKTASSLCVTVLDVRFEAPLRGDAGAVNG